jgi:ribonuclease P protein component
MLSKTAHFALHCNSLDVSKPMAVHPDAPAHRVALFSKSGIWLGAMVPKRWAKRAVTRNAIKRQIYAVSAHYEAALTQSAHVVRLRATFDRSNFVSASSDALKTAVRLELFELFERMQRHPHVELRSH